MITLHQMSNDFPKWGFFTQKKQKTAIDLLCLSFQNLQAYSDHKFVSDLILLLEMKGV